MPNLKKVRSNNRLQMAQQTQHTFPDVFEQPYLPLGQVCKALHVFSWCRTPKFGGCSMFIIFTQLFISSNRSYQKWSGILFSIAHSAHTKVSLSRFCRIYYVWLDIWYLNTRLSLFPPSTRATPFQPGAGRLIWQILFILLNLIRNILGTSKNVLPLQIYSQSLEDAQASDRIRPN